MQISFDTPTGPFFVTEEDGAITAAGWGRATAPEATDLLQEARAQVDAYFDGRLTEFDLPLIPPGSAFQKQVCARMSEIPFGETRTYGELAALLRAPAQAVGQGCGGNPIPLLIPCHRVLGANGLGGFSGGTGIETKVALLRHEGAAGLLI